VRFKQWWSGMGVPTDLMILLIRKICWLLRIYLSVNTYSSFFKHFKILYTALLSYVRYISSLLNLRLHLFVNHQDIIKTWISICVWNRFIFCNWIRNQQSKDFFSSFTYSAATVLVVSFPCFFNYFLKDVKPRLRYMTCKIWCSI